MDTRYTDASADAIRQAADRYDAVDHETARRAWSCACVYFGPDGADHEIEEASAARIVALAEGWAKP